MHLNHECQTITADIEQEQEILLMLIVYNQ